MFGIATEQGWVGVTSRLSFLLLLSRLLVSSPPPPFLLSPFGFMSAPLPTLALESPGGYFQHLTASLINTRTCVQTHAHHTYTYTGIAEYESVCESEEPTKVQH